MLLPKSYEIIFDVDLDNFNFSGKEKITVVAKNNMKEIELDCVNLKIKKCAVDTELIPYKLDEKRGKLIINKKLRSGKYNIFIEFEGKMDDWLMGFYRSRYEVGGKEKYLATTQFEPMGARTAFPCFDGPENKAIFQISLVVDRNLTTISNTLPVEEKTLGNKKLVRFSRTPAMSTYLLYIGVGEFEMIEDRVGNILVRVITTPGKSQYGKFALDCAKKFLKFYQEYFDFPYILPKLDLITIPDFESRAMENWGAITGRENALLFYPEKSSKILMESNAELIAHEIVHQWFGNLVTMKSFSDIWLNESFATFLAYKALDYFWHEWNVWSQYMMDAVFDGMALDGLKSSHPIALKIKKSYEVREVFDEISYDKGGSILRMLEGHIGSEEFRKSLRKYISKFKFRNTEAKDLWNCFDVSVRNLLKLFTTQEGFPLVKTTVKGRKLLLTQERFLFEGKSKKQKWHLPLVIQYDKDKFCRHVLRKQKEEIFFSEIPKFININSDYSGFFISEYSEEILESLEKNIDALSSKTRLGLIHDVFSLVLSGKFEFSKFLEYVEKFYPDEKDPAASLYLLGKLTEVYLLSSDTRSRDLAAALSEKILERTGYEPKKEEPPLDAVLRALALHALSLFEDERAIKFGQEKFKEFLNTGSLHPDLRSIVYSIAVWSDDSNYSKVLELYKKADSEEEKVKFLKALANTKNKKLIKKTLNYTLTKKVRFSQTIYVLASAARNPLVKETTLKWFMKNWGELTKRSGKEGVSLLRNMLKIIIPFCAVGREKEVVIFFRKNKISGLERTFEQVSEELRINSGFVKRISEIA